MKNTVQFIMKTEELAGNLYRKASQRFQERPEISRFLRDLAEDEAWHYKLMARISEIIEKTDLNPPGGILPIAADQEKIQKPFLENLDRLQAGTLTIRDILHCIAVTEFSEWNDFFLFVVNSLKEKGKEFEHAADRMENHRQRIEAFLSSYHDADMEAGEALTRMKQVSRIWRERFLIVEDAEEVAYLLKSILENLGDVEVAENGEEGLRKIAARHYNVILSDVKMPVMNGIDMYRKAVDRDPDIRHRFLFLTGHLSQDLLGFFTENKLPYLEKPAGINEIRHAVKKVLRERPPDPSHTSG